MGIKCFSQLLMGYWAAYIIQPETGNVSFDWLWCAQHFAKYPTDIISLVENQKSTAWLFQVIEHWEYYVCVAHWGRWTRMLAVRASQPKVLGRPMSGQTWNPIRSAAMCLWWEFACHHFSFFSGVAAICIPSGIISSYVWPFSLPKEKFIFTLIDL